MRAVMFDVSWVRLDLIVCWLQGELDATGVGVGGNQLPRAVSAAASVVLDGKLLVIGGYDGYDITNVLANVLEYDPAERSRGNARASVEGHPRELGTPRTTRA